MSALEQWIEEVDGVPMLHTRANEHTVAARIATDEEVQAHKEALEKAGIESDDALVKALNELDASHARNEQLVGEIARLEGDLTAANELIVELQAANQNLRAAASNLKPHETPNE